VIKRAGQLRHTFQLQRATESRDEAGGVTQVWRTVAQPFGSLEGVTGDEFLRADALQAEIDYRARLRYRGDVTPDMRLTLGSRSFDIRRVVDPDGRRDELELLLRERL
jgi:SPP1 family predicted phage head-tail adaptor